MRFLFTSTAVWLIMASLVALGEPNWNIVATAQAQSQRIAGCPKFTTCKMQTVHRELSAKAVCYEAVKWLDSSSPLKSPDQRS